MTILRKVTAMRVGYGWREVAVEVGGAVTGVGMAALAAWGTWWLLDFLT